MATKIKKKTTPVKKKKVAFQLEAPEATTVLLSGDFNSWNMEEIPMKRQSKRGPWKASVQLEYGTYEYKFLVDGKWRVDDENSKRVENIYGSMNSLVEVN